MFLWSCFVCMPGAVPCQSSCWQSSCRQTLQTQISITSVLLLGFMLACAMQATDLEVNMNAVERMVEYTSQQPEGAGQGHSRAPPQSWPQAGAIVVDDLQACKPLSAGCNAPRCLIRLQRFGCTLHCISNPCCTCCPRKPTLVLEGFSEMGAVLFCCVSQNSSDSRIAAWRHIAPPDILSCAFRWGKPLAPSIGQQLPAASGLPK